MVSPKYRVQCCTYNGHLLGLKSSQTNPDLTAWLIPTLAEGSLEHLDSSPPDLVAVGFQEMIPLHLSLLGFTNEALNQHHYKLKAAIESHAEIVNSTSTSTTSTTEISTEKETYTLLAKKVLGGIALLVYGRDKTITNKVVDVRVATSGVGVFGLMGNKGAVGVRISVDQFGEGDDEDETMKEKIEINSDEKLGEGIKDDSTGDTVYTFVTAHLAAHDHGLARRNQDWQSIVERLIFSTDGPSEVYEPTKKKDVFKSLVKNNDYVGAEGIQIYDTSYLFFFGDLNYRISTTTPKPLPLHLISHKLANDLPSLLQQDQLKTAQSHNLTLHNLQEGTITFKPTYKYIPGTLDQFKKFSSRVPGWCDRILFATWADGIDGAGKILKVGKDGEEKIVKRKGPKVELYRSVMSFVSSDHKPVSLIYSLK